MPSKFHDRRYFLFGGVIAMTAIFPSATRAAKRLETDLSADADGAGVDRIANAIRRVENVAELQALSGIRNGARVSAIGYSTTMASQVPDGGGGEFVYRATSTATPNGGTVFAATGMGSGRFHRVFSDDVSVKWFGALANGISYDHVAIQAAIDYVEKIGRTGGVVRVPRGSYKMGGKLRIGGFVILKGENYFSSSLVWDAMYTGDNCVDFGPDQSGNFGFSGSYTFGSRIEDIDLNANNADLGLNKAVVYTPGAHQFSGLKNVFIRNFRNVAIHYDQGLGGPAAFSLDEVELQGGAAAPAAGATRGLWCSGAGAVVSARQLIIQGQASNIMPAGVLMEKDNLLLSGGHFEQCAAGVLLAQNDTVKRTNVISGVTGHNSVATLVEVAAASNLDYTLTGLSNVTVSAAVLNVLKDKKSGVTVGGIGGRSLSLYNSGVAGQYKWGYGTETPEGTLHVHGSKVLSAQQVTGNVPPRIAEFAASSSGVSGTVEKLIDFSIPAEPFFALIEVTAAGSRAPSAGAGTGRIAKATFSISRGGSGSDVALDTYAAEGFDVAASTAGGTAHKSAIALEIFRAGAESSASAQVVRVGAVMGLSTGATGSVVAHVKAVGHSTLVRV